MLYQFPTCGGLKFKILCAIWECQSFTKEKKGLGKIPHLSLVAKPLVTHGEFYFSPLVASPLRGEKSNPFFSSVKDWVIPILQAKFYYIPPLEGRFQTFWGIDIWNSIPHCWSYPIWCSTIGNWSIPHMWGIKIIMLYQFPTCGELKLSLLWRN